MFLLEKQGKINPEGTAPKGGRQDRQRPARPPWEAPAEAILKGFHGSYLKGACVFGTTPWADRTIEPYHQLAIHIATAIA
jgi:hypothetical protein